MGMLQYIGTAEIFNPLINYVQAGQAYANLRQRNQLATLLAIGCSALLWWQTQGMPNRLKAICLGLLVAAAAATGSRTGLLQLLLLLALAVNWRRARMTMAVALLGYALAAVLLPIAANLDPMQSGILGRVEQAPAGCSSRLTLWSNVLHLIAQKPWFGWGWGELDYAHFVTLYPGERFCEILGNGHNLPLHLAVELGVPFALLVCGTLVWLVMRTKPWREQDPTRQLAWSVLAVIGLHSLLEYPLWYGPFQLATVLAVWMLWSTRPSAKETQEVDEKAASISTRKWSMALALSMLAALSFVAWDYWRISQIYLPVSARAAAYREDTLAKIQGSWLFQNQVQFAELGVTPLTQANAEHIHTLALNMLHFSPETMVAEKLIESASLLGKDEEVRFYMQRYKAAYPLDFERWTQANASGARYKTP